MIRVGIVGAAFAGNLHAESLVATGRVEIVGVVATSAASRDAFSQRWNCPSYVDVSMMVAGGRLDAITLATPNRFHHDATVVAARAGVHVICEKPLALNLREADAMVRVCQDAGVHLLYAEQLCFAPRYQKVRELVRSGALGTVIQVQHHERHGGPHATWFHDPTLSGGGVLLDMGCHGIEVTRWLLDRPAVRSVHARLGIFKHTQGVVDDHAVVTLGFDSGAVAIIDSSWAAPGGIDERLEVLGTKGSVSADLARGQAMLVYSDVGVGYAAEKVERATGWTFVAHEEARTWGWFGEMAHFVDCIEGRADPEVSGVDGRAVLEIVMAAYQSAADDRVVSLPFESDLDIPCEPWLRARREFGHPL